MPREIVAYACKYHCGQRVNTHKKAIIDHEKICFKNPRRKACKTCVLWIGKGECLKNHLKEDEYATYNCKFHKQS